MVSSMEYALYSIAYVDMQNFLLRTNLLIARLPIFSATLMVFTLSIIQRPSKFCVNNYLHISTSDVSDLLVLLYKQFVWYCDV